MSYAIKTYFDSYCNCTSDVPVTFTKFHFLAVILKHSIGSKLYSNLIKYMVVKS